MINYKNFKNNIQIICKDWDECVFILNNLRDRIYNGSSNEENYINFWAYNNCDCVDCTCYDKYIVEIDWN